MKRNKLLTILFTVIGLLVIVVVSFVVLVSARVKKEITVSIGGEISTEDFRRFSWDKGLFSWVEKPDSSTVGEKEGKIQVFPITYRVTVVVSETGSS